MRQVFGKNCVRDDGAQRAWIESEAQKQATRNAIIDKGPYVIRGKKVIFNKGCEMSAKDLAGILAQLS